jgi:hypothetical protein
MRVHFMHDHDHVTAESTIAYEGGREYTVAKEIGEAAVKAGAAREIKPEADAGGE